MQFGRLRHTLRILATTAGSIWFSLAFAASSPMQFARLGADAGLSAGGVMSIIQDRQGFIWLATEDGLDRYDGYEIKHHVHDRHGRNGPPINWISTLDEDASGTLWVGTDGGGVVGRYPASGRFEDLPLIGGARPLPAGEKVRVVRAARDGVLWIGTREHGLFSVDASRLIVRRFRHSDADAATLSSDSIYALLQSRDGTLWVGTAEGLDHLDPNTGRVERLPLPTRQLSATHRAASGITALLEDHRGNLWIATPGGLLRRSPHADGYVSYRNRPGDAQSLPSDVVQTLLEDDAQRLWIGTEAGLARFDRDTNRFDTYRHNPADATTLPDNSVIALYQDRGGLLWVGTKAGGVATWNSRAWSFGQHTAPSADASGESDITAFATAPDGTLWIANVGAGLDAVDRVHGTVTHYQHNPHAADSLPDDRVMALLMDRRGTLWVGTMTAGLSRFDSKTQRFTTFRHDPNDPTSLAAPGVMSLLEDSKGRLWVGTYGGGLSLFHADTGRFTHYKTDPANASTLSNDRATALAEDPSGRIWVGTDGGGLCLLDPETGRVDRFGHDPQNPHTLSADTVYAVRVDSAGRTWVGTRGGGLDEVIGSDGDPALFTWRNFAESDGLPNTTIYGIEPEASGRLWLSTNRGLARFDPVSHEVRNFRRAHGLQGDEFNFGAHHKSAQGEIFFGGPSGYNAFFPERLQFDDQPPPVVLTAFLRLNEPAPTNVPHEQLRDIKLGYRDHVVSFEFAALDFASPGDNRYQYRLDGFDKDWVDAGAKHRVTYTNLSGGTYTFRVRAANSDGKWNEAGLVLPLFVDPPPWATPWAYAGYVLGFGFLIFATWNSQHRKLRREELYAQRLEQDVRDRTLELDQRNRDLENLNRQLKEASLTDRLTGLGNRRYLADALEAAIGTAADGPSPVFALLIVDLDHLKPINDTHGHEAGDQILKQVAKILQLSCRITDLIARWGGDEFVVVFHEQDLDQAATLAERLRTNVAKHVFHLGDGRSARTSCSIGFSRYPFTHADPQLATWEQCLALADAALYQAKKDRNEWFGWAGAGAVTDIVALLRNIEKDAARLEREGYLDVRRPAFRPDDTIDTLALGHRGAASARGNRSI